VYSYQLSIVTLFIIIIIIIIIIIVVVVITKSLLFHACVPALINKVFQ